MIGGLGTTELILIFALIVLLFGASKLPELARSMGTSMGEFKKAQRESDLSLKEFEKTIKNVPEDEKKSKIQQMALDNGIDITDKTDDELLDEIQAALQKPKEASEP
ncbi:MAG: twin-arginine translocase TatA/TatE family subunit [Methanosarcinaceae archaeon]|nr:twin-arginine translocase TatA/TatE family subunit [Methanosarcinaceae archaeon]MDF1533174.1 twin-arginine translocase TatA/TatE family subunit [Methanosarcinaceae archaeon]